MASKKHTPRPILVNGEIYTQGIQKRSGGGTKKYPRSYEAARQLVLDKIEKASSDIANIPGEKRTRSVVLSLRLNPAFLAKSYYPETLLNESRLEAIGSRRWTPPKSVSPSGNYGKMVFFKTMDASLTQLKANLARSSNELTNKWKNDIQKVEDISLLAKEEQLLGFAKNWNGGAVELVLHPLRQDSDEALDKLLIHLKSVGVAEKDIKYSRYGRGLTFVAASLSRSQLKAVGGFNPLRTAHPIASWQPEMRSLGSAPSPKPNPEKRASAIKVGIFDGGAKDDLPLLSGHVRNHDLAPRKASQSGVAHGSCVAGAVLYGRLNDYGKEAIVPIPKVSVESFRVLPPKDNMDIELYEAIDIIESLVPQRDDIKVYNISFGPRGPILDDDISRFTHVLDSLAYSHKVLFTVAVGNDGAAVSPYDRLQSPSDSSNNLGVGAWTHKIEQQRSRIIRAPYSCVGPGREGCKVKPDLVSFGGCENHPFAGVSLRPDEKILTQGTSFAAPMVAGAAAELIGRCDRLNPLMARVLLIHGAQHPSGKPDLELGHGCLADTVDEMITCDESTVTVLFQGSIRPQAYAKLPIPFPKDFSSKGRLGFRWTLGSWSIPDPDNPDEYTICAIEDLFYPHSQKYGYLGRNPDTGKLEKKVLNLTVESEREMARDLERKGWSKSELPVTDSVKLAYGKELERRLDFKWDSVVQRKKAKESIKVQDPFFILHALGRNGLDADEHPVHYGLAVTLECSKYTGDFYADVISAYNRLEPLNVRAVSEVSVPLTISS